MYFMQSKKTDSYPDGFASNRGMSNWKNKWEDFVKQLHIIMLSYSREWYKEDSKK